jgi:hypothetical protein
MGRCRPGRNRLQWSGSQPGIRTSSCNERDRGRDRRRQRQRDADRGRRALRALPAPPAARRVGRGEHRSYCILFADAASELARRRLDAIAAERDGFKLAEVDLALRGEGEILGTRSTACRASGSRSSPTTSPCSPTPGARYSSSSSERDRWMPPSWARCWTPSRALRRRGDRRLRIVAGEFGGRRLATPPRRSAAVRPTSDRVREALFSIRGGR